MPTQHDFQRVTDCIIEPMKRHWGAEFDSETVGDFVDDLARFNESTLKAAMEKLRGEQKRKPTLAHVVEACKQSVPKQRSAEGNQPNPWLERSENIQKMISDYLKQFMAISTIWRQAEVEKWDLDLRAYVQAVAEVQAQMIIGLKNVGWSSVIIFGAGETITQDQISIFLREQRQQAQTGQIDVPIPTGRIAAWKTYRALMQRLQDDPQPQRAKRIQANPQLEAEIARQVEKRIA